MELSTENLDTWRLIKLRGEFTVASLSAIRDELARLDTIESPQVALEFSKVKNIDSSAINLILSFGRKIKSRNGSIAIINPSNEIKDVFEIVSLEDSVPVFASREALLNAPK